MTANESEPKRTGNETMNRRLLITTGVLVAAATGGLAYSMAFGAERVVVGRDVPARSRVSIDQIDHGPWNALLEKYVDDDGRVDYATWLRTRDDVATLDRYLDHLSTASRTKRAAREARLAYWINVYNAVTVRGILREYPTKSIRNHTSVTGYNIWKHLLLPVDGERYSLEDVEHEILRKMDEPRIHFAIVCASVGCPRLWNQAYTADRLDEQLTANARNFFAQPRNFRVDGRTAHLSSILDWFGKDFGATNSRQLKAIAPYVPAEHRAAVARGRLDVKYLDYDWSLNAQ